MMEEARGETFLWHELRINFIKDFNFIPQNEALVEIAKQIKQFIQPTENQPLQDHRQTKDCNNLQIWSKSQSTHLQLENEKKAICSDGNPTTSKQQNLSDPS